MDTLEGTYEGKVQKLTLQFNRGLITTTEFLAKMVEVAGDHAEELAEDIRRGM